MKRTLASRNVDAVVRPQQTDSASSSIRSPHLTRAGGMSPHLRTPAPCPVAMISSISGCQSAESLSLLASNARSTKNSISRSDIPRSSFAELLYLSTARSDGKVCLGSPADDSARPRRRQLFPEAANPDVSAPLAAHVV